MKRRIISIISVLAVICSLFQVPVLAAKETEVDSYKLSVLQSLGIIEEKLPTRVTTDTFVNALMGYVLEDDEKNIYTSETFARSVGMIEHGEEYKKNGTVSVDVASRFAVTLLGYTEEILPNNNYKSIASSEGLLKGITRSDSLKPHDMVIFLYNLLDAKPMLMGTLSDKGTTYYINSKQTLLSVYRDIYNLKDVVSADENTSIYAEQGVGENRVKIGDYIFTLACNFDSSLLGSYVNAYIKDDGDIDATVVVIKEVENRNKRLTVWDEKIVSVNRDYTEMEYETETERIKKIKIAKHPKVIINGKFYGDYTRADLMPKNGYLEFLDNNDDGRYEIIFVWSYQTIVVDSINATEKLIINKLEFRTPRPPLDLDPDGADIKYSVIKDGKEIKLSEIAVGDVLSVAMSNGTGNTRLCEIIVCSDKSEFCVTDIDMSEREISDGNTVYTLGEDYLGHINYKNEDIKLGNVYEFRLDAFGRIAYSKILSEDMYVLFFRAYEEDSDDNSFVRYLDMSGEWKSSKLAKRISVNGVSGKVGEMYATISAMEPQVVKIKLNSDGEVRYITTADETALEDAKQIEDGFTETQQGNTRYLPICASFDNLIYLDNGAKLFVMPDSEADTYDREKYDREKYYVMDAASFFVEEEFSINAYDVDRFGYTKVLSVKGSYENKRMSENLFVVTGIKTVMDMNGEKRMQLKGCGSGYKDISFLAKEEDILSGLRKGDVIKFILDITGLISKVSKPIVRLGDTFEPFNSGTGNEYYATRHIKATVAEIDYEKNRILLDYDTGEVAFPYRSDINCMEYNQTTEECDLITYDSVIKGDKVMVMTKHFGIAELVRISE